MFDLYDTEKLVEWKKFRDHLEVSQTPFDDLAEFWSKAPFVGRYLNPDCSSSWPDPWKLILDGKFDDLAICLGMFYTLKLTERFKEIDCEIKQSLEKNSRFILVIENDKVLNWQYRTVSCVNDVNHLEFRVVLDKSHRV